MLLPGGREVKGKWTCGDIRGGDGNSLEVHLSGTHAGKWTDWANQDEHKGDLLDLWRFAKDLTLPEALKEAKAYLGIHEEPFYHLPKKYLAPPENVTTELSPGGKAMNFLTDTRGILPDIVKMFKVEVLPDKAIAFPCYSLSGKLINRSYRTIPKNGEKKVVWQDKGCAPALFGWQALKSSAFEKRTILLCEGQIDAMTWTQWGIDALSIPSGTVGTWIDYEWENLAAFDHIYLSFDMDGAGGEIARKTIQRLGAHRCMIVEIPKKDANDCLLAGFLDDDAREWIGDAKAPTIEGLVLAKDLRGRIMAELEAKVEPYTHPLFRVLWPEVGFYPYPGDVTAWTGFTNHGKSTLLNFLIGELIVRSEKVFVASMEVPAERSSRKIATAAMKRQVTKTLMDGFLNDGGHLLILVDKVGYIEKGRLLEMMWFAFRRWGCSRFVIDSLMRIDGLEEDYPAQGKFMNELQEFAKTTGSFVDIVCHPKKAAHGQRPSEMDIKGSSLIANNVDNIVSICRNPEKEKKRKDGSLTPEQERLMHDAEVRIEKQREIGWTGLFKFSFDQKTFSYKKYH